MNDRYKTPDEQHQEELVMEYLVQHPDFFSRHPEILENLALPHDSGHAISLVERQVAVLRQRNVELRHRLNELIDNARANDQLFDKSKRLVLSLLDSQTLPGAITVLHDSLRDDFTVPSVALLLFGEELDNPAPGLARVISQEQAQTTIAALMNGNRPLCGILRPEEVRFLFDDKSGDIGSVAAVRLGRKKPLGILALGNPDPYHYQSTSGTLFLSHIADVLDRVLPPLL
ncbi:MAG TPA: DUF484 family protein [Porticoccaceae bacterium]